MTTSTSPRRRSSAASWCPATRSPGPKRAPRRSERFPSLIRIETINGRPAAELADGGRFDDLPAAFASEQIKLGTDDPTLKAIEWLTPIGKGSRVAIGGEAAPARATRCGGSGRPWPPTRSCRCRSRSPGSGPRSSPNGPKGKVEPGAAVSFAGSEDAQDGAVELVVDQARRLAARGSDAVVLIDTLDGVSPLVARKALASARNIVDGGR